MSYCAQCGTRLPDEARFCPSCGAARASEATVPVTPAARRSPPSGPWPAEPPPAALAPALPVVEDIALASIGRRATAHLIDFVPVLVVFVVIGSMVASETGNMTETGFEMTGGPALLTLGLTYLVVLFYFTLFEALPAGKTFGKWLAGIRVANEIGRRASFGQAFMRNLLRLIDGLPLYLIGLGLAASSERRQRLGDRVAHTLVLRTAGPAKPEPGERPRAKVKFSMGGDNPASYLDP